MLLQRNRNLPTPLSQTAITKPSLQSADLSLSLDENSKILVPTQNLEMNNLHDLIPLVFVLCLSCLFTPCSAQDRCIYDGIKEFDCTPDSPFIREKLDTRTAFPGAPQRIEGSEDEKRNIREVLNRMDDYFLNEVLAMPEYEHVRSRW